MTFILIRKGVAHLLPTALMAAIALPAFAGNGDAPLNRDNAYTLSPFVGGHTFDNKQALETSPVFGLRAGYNFTPRWGAELALGYTLAESEIANFPESDVYQYSLDGLYHFNPDGKLVPFLVLGIGGETINRPAPGFADSDDEFLNFGVGVKYFIADNVALRGDLRDVMLNESDNTNLVYSIGVTFLMGGDKRTKPVVADCVPCSATPAASDTTPPYVTLTTPFHAATGVPAQRLVRAAFSEEMDKSTITDKTVTVWQGKTQVKGKVLAPTGTTASLSHDAEFLPSTTYTGRVSSGVKDLAGNAMVSDYVWSFTTAAALNAAGKTVTIDKLVTLEDTHFKFDSAELTPEGQKALDQNIQFMHDNPNLTARIAGYSSASGTEDYNQALSERRANAVMAYLVDHGGVGAERLDTIGYGETRPSAYEELPSDLRSKAAKANMRVLFEVIVK